MVLKFLRDSSLMSAIYWPLTNAQCTYSDLKRWSTSVLSLTRAYFSRRPFSDFSLTKALSFLPPPHCLRILSDISRFQLEARL